MKTLLSLLVLVVLSGGIYYFYQKGDITDAMLTISELPKDRPDNMVIEIGNGGGMLPISKGIYISKDSCYQSRWAYEAKNKTYFKLSASELDQLYKVFVDNKFDGIKTRHIQAPDRGGTSVYLRINRKTYQIHNSGGTFVKKSSAGAFKEVVSTVKNMVASKITPLKQGFTIWFYAPVRHLIASGHVGSATADISQGFKKEDALPDSLHYQILRGSHRFRLSFTTKDTLANGKTHLGGTFLLDIDANTKGIKVVTTEEAHELSFDYIK